MDRFKVVKVKNENPPGLGDGVHLNRYDVSTISDKAADPRKHSLAQLSKESLPRLDNYRLSKRTFKRPTIGELQGEIDLESPNDASKQADPAGSGHPGFKLGWIQGVLIPCLLNIWGVMLFLRLSWVVAQSGVTQSLIIIGISTVVCVITTLSMSAISTNGEVKGGGVYYIISRSLGPEFGASVGIVFAFANAVAASMNTIGFCASLNDLLKSFDTKIVDGGVNDIRIVGSVALLVMVVICAVGMDWEAKAQNFLIVTIVVAIFGFIIGCLMGPGSDLEKARGFVGFDLDTMKQNMGPDYRYSEGMYQTFFSVFAIFFPSVTGIQAGANISGDLKDPASAIPKGTMLSIAISMFSYALFIVFAGGAALRDASGDVVDVMNGTLIQPSPCIANHSCEWGLHNSYTMMQVMSSYEYIVYAGCFAATLSTALTNLLSVPRLIQALGIDQIYPGLIFFSKGYGKHGEPYRGYVLTYFVSLAFLLIAELNVIAPLISTFYLASYALINFCTFHAALIKPLGWRPTFKYYNVWLSLFGFALCVAIMFLIDWLSSLITFIIIFALYLIVVYRKPDVNWGSSTQAQIYKTALANSYKLQTVGDHVKNYNPQVLVLAGRPHSRPPLLDLAGLITRHNSLMVVGEVIPTKMSYKARQAALDEGTKFLKARKVKSFYNIIDGLNWEEGARALIQATGFGKMAPNVVLMGFKTDWQNAAIEDLTMYFNVLHNTFSNRMGLGILRMPTCLDFSSLNLEIRPLDPNASNGTLTTMASDSNIPSYGGSSNELFLRIPTTSLLHSDSNLNLEGMHSNSTTLTIPQMAPIPRLQITPIPDQKIVYSTVNGSSAPPELVNAMEMFNRKQPKGFIDVWWLYDDGGLTMLLPHIISQRSTWANCHIRVFALTTRKVELEQEEKNMANLLNKLRIGYKSLVMLQGVTDLPQPATIAMHDHLIAEYNNLRNPNEHISAEERATLLEKTYRQLRLRELLMAHSSDARLVVMSLPMPRRDSISAPLYMSWMDMLSRNMPPMLFVRGNQNSVLTLYS